jgi:hypothetical protein
MVICAPPGAGDVVNVRQLRMTSGPGSRLTVYAAPALSPAVVLEVVAVLLTGSEPGYLVADLGCLGRWLPPGAALVADVVGETWAWVQAEGIIE